MNTPQRTTNTAKPKPVGLARLERWQRAETLVQQVKERDLVNWDMPSASGNGVYIVEYTDSEWTCTCLDQTGRQLGGCKHIYTVRLARMVAVFRQQALSPIARQVPSFLHRAGNAYRFAYEGNWESTADGPIHRVVLARGSSAHRCQILQQGSPLLSAGHGHRQQPFHEASSGIALGAETALAP